MFFFNKKPVEQPATINEPQNIDVIYSKVYGITFANEDGTKRQDVIKRIAQNIREEYGREALYLGYTKKEQQEDWIDEITEFEGIDIDLELQPYEYKGKPALYVVSDEGIVGNISADLVTDLKDKSVEVVGEITGGKVRTLDEGTKTLTYGMNLTIYVDNG